MKKIGINFDANYAFKTATGEIEQSYINVYWNEEYGVGINPESEIIQAIKSLDMRIPIRIVEKNEYENTNWPKIEIVLWKDYKNYFLFSKPPEYLPKIDMPVSSGTTLSWEKKTPTKQEKSNITPTKTNIWNKEAPASPYKVAPGEWEEL